MDIAPSVSVLTEMERRNQFGTYYTVKERNSNDQGMWKVWLSKRN